MDKRHKTSLLLFFCFILAQPSSGFTLDVCASCHINATCEDKLYDSGKVCNCRYGFVGNGRTLCQDKDECQIGAMRICGPHTTCHNTFGSYYCTCLEGYSPSNNMNIFIPNDGTHCRDVDECEVQGLCGQGALCSNLEGSYECSCQLGYTIYNGREPFHPQRDLSTCREVNCGPPLLPYNTSLWSATGTTYGKVVMLVCEEGFLWRSGDNTSVCGADGLWTKPSIICEGVDCGSPPTFPHSHMLWDQRSLLDSKVFYQCDSGYNDTGGSNVSTCGAAGHWEGADVFCREIECGNPPRIDLTDHLWSGRSAPGSSAEYFCKDDFKSTGGNNQSVCGFDGQWTRPTLSCQEILCGDPPALQNAEHNVRIRFTPGSTATYRCQAGFYSDGGNYVALCTPDGYWTEPNISCTEINCQQPVHKANSKLLWDGTSRLNSEVQYQCNEGFITLGLKNSSRCGENGIWEDVDLVCEAKCGPVPVLAHSEVIWQNTSVAVHQCVLGFHSWRGHNTSVCSSSGVWQRATLTCVEIQPAISHLSLADEKCLHWRAEKFDEDTEVYKITYDGSRDFDLTFRDQRKQFLRSKSSQVDVCLDLLPVTNYTIHISAVSARFTVSISANTSLPVPSAPTVYYKEFQTPVPTLSLRRSPNSLDPLSVYQVFVLPVDNMMVFDCLTPEGPNSSGFSKSAADYISALIHVSRVKSEMNFTVGDGLWYEGFSNAPLENGHSYYIILRVESRWKRAMTSSCVLWAKVKGTAYILRLASLCAAASVALLSLAALAGYTYLWAAKHQ